MTGLSMARGTFDMVSKKFLQCPLLIAQLGLLGWGFRLLLPIFLTKSKIAQTSIFLKTQHLSNGI
jgi:hypothetical protein